MSKCNSSVKIVTSGSWANPLFVSKCKGLCSQRPMGLYLNNWARRTVPGRPSQKPPGWPVLTRLTQVFHFVF